jgi:hypothetical protein
MKPLIEDTKNQTTNTSSALIADVKNTIQLVLDESGRSRIGRNSENPMVAISENKRLEGDLGMQWTINLTVIDNKEKPFLIICCIDFTASKETENALTKTEAAC